MFRNRFFRKLFHHSLVDIDQVKLVYFLSLVVGLLSALAAAVLKNAIHYTHQILTEGITRESGSYLYLAYPLIGMLLTLLFVRYIVKDKIGHGISRILHAISKKKSHLKAHNTWTSIIASTLTIGFGGSVRAEAPIVLTGSSIGSTVGRFFKLNYKNITLLIGCGAAGAVSGIFKAPIAGIVFTLEILMFDLTISSIVPLLISSVTAATVAYFLMGDKVLFTFNIVESFNISNIPWYMVLGIISGLISLYFSKMTIFLEGVVSLDDVREIMFQQELYDTTYVKDLMTIPPSYIDKKENIDTVMEAFRKTGAWNLPVLDNGYYVGFISKSRIYSTYRELLIGFSEE